MVRAWSRTRMGTKSLSSGNARVRCLRVQERSALREGPGNTTVLAAAANFRATSLAPPARAGLIGTESTNCPEARLRRQEAGTAQPSAQAERPTAGLLDSLLASLIGARLAQ